MLTVEQCLHFDVLQKAQVIAGSHGLGRPVQFAHVIEEPDIESWIRPGLAILTTGHPFRDDSIHETWFRELNTHGAACVMVACGRYLATIPPPMIALADDYAIPVIQLPWDVPFVNITAAIHQYLVNEHVKDWTRLTQWQTQLTHAALTARSLDELMHKFSLITRRLVRIVPRSVKTTGPSLFDSHHTAETAIHTQFETITTKIPQLIGILSEPVDVIDIAATYQHLLRLLTHATPGSLISS